MFERNFVQTRYHYAVDGEKTNVLKLLSHEGTSQKNFQSWWLGGKIFMQNDLNQLMLQALSEARKGFSEGEVPVGAVLATGQGEIIASAHNQPIALNDPTAHAEILAMRKAGSAIKNYRLTQTILVITIEPCLMCMGAALNARIAVLAYGAPDPKAGAAGSVYDLSSDNRLNHKIQVIPGVMEEECKTLIQDFFRARRKKI